LREDVHEEVVARASASKEILDGVFLNFYSGANSRIMRLKKYLWAQTDWAVCASFRFYRSLESGDQNNG